MEYLKEIEIDEIYSRYYWHCNNMWNNEIYIEWLSKEEFLERIKTDDELRTEWLR